ncbi:hydantoinase/oxoprolinase family protein [uncultured Ruegeria sp.]|uniref:hydantoinase/oxoprolinase family protein n=1 Tax=uncultured Ruegeria sp. TaxID=259304 RepID=UPI0026387DBE|nr:hydantoinase/oxoprolinase family protein [uncultured Ruegeria sp.]
MTKATKGRIRLSADIGGTFTDVVLETSDQQYARKVLTTHQAPEMGVLKGINVVLEAGNVDIGDVDLIIHGTTLATNTLIERNGANTVLVTTEGFIDVIEMGYENRFEQYDINVVKPKLLVDRSQRFGVTERLAANGDTLIELDEGSVRALVPKYREMGVESIAICLLHAYVDGRHEDRVEAIFREELPGVLISKSSAIAPEIREYERTCTTVANAYVQPQMAGYLGNLDQALREMGATCPLFLMTSGGGLATVETASQYPVRLVESGPAGGAILAAQVAQECNLDEVLSYDMGGTTAKICLIDSGRPKMSRTFEVDRQYRFMKGSGMPIRIPVIEMVEIGAGGGSIGHIDQMGRVQVGPESAGSEPGPACYDLGGTRPAVTDANLVLGNLDADNFAGGRMKLSVDNANEALGTHIADKLGMTSEIAAFAMREVVDENMSNAARVHAIEAGKNVSTRTMVAFGGGAPMHVSRMAEKLGIDRVIVPTGAGVGSAVGFLRAPVAYEVVRSHHVRLNEPDADAVNAMIADMRAEAEAVVHAGAEGVETEEECHALMRYVGQGHELLIKVPTHEMSADELRGMIKVFDKVYEDNYSRSVPAMGVEALTWTLTVRTVADKALHATGQTKFNEGSRAPTIGTRKIFDAESGIYLTAQVYDRDAVTPGQIMTGPAAIVEEQTTTILSKNFRATLNSLGYIDIRRNQGDEA